MKWSKKLPNRKGYYWYYEWSRNEKCIVEVTKQDGKFYASNEEFIFDVSNSDKKDKWCYIPTPK